MNISQPQHTWKIGYQGWTLLLVTAALFGFIFHDSALDLIHWWNSREEYSHAYLIPFISIFLIWQQKDRLQCIPFDGAWAGLMVSIIGIAVYLLGTMATIYIVAQYALIVVLMGVCLSFFGNKGFRLVAIPIAFLVFMIPLPPFLYQSLSAKLQLISSELGVSLIRLFDISVYLEGNVIDLGAYKLQVAEACNGLRYLFPLMSFGFLCAYLFAAPLWQRVTVFLSTIPITVLMNSMRIGIIGILVEKWGRQQAEGFLHDFEGWAIFMACLGVLFGEIWYLASIVNKQRFSEVFGIRYPGAACLQTGAQRVRSVPAPFVASVVALLATAMVAYGLDNRSEVLVQRKAFALFPAHIGKWVGVHSTLDQVYLRALKLSDYALIDYTDQNGDWINFYAAYYDSQRAGGSAHSPRSCIPGGGWKIEDLSRRRFDDIDIGGTALEANRVEIRRGDKKQLIYYWFQQRGRIIQSEYLVKWFLFWDSLTKRRTDGALVRVSTVLKPNEEWRHADRRLSQFISGLAHRLSEYVPD